MKLGFRDEYPKGVSGIPVKRCTMALKFEVSVFNSVVGALLEALDRFLPALAAAAPPPFAERLPTFPTVAAGGDCSSVVVTDVASAKLKSLDMGAETPRR